jgi:DNA polymerase III subunit gamma/tau
MTESLITAHRPKSFKDVIGQDEVVRSYRLAIKDRTSAAFLLTGPKGSGKTTLAYLGAEYAGATGRNIIDVDAASNSGVDEFRALATHLSFRPLGRGGKVEAKAIIIDECHRATGNAFDSVLKAVEKPPEWVWWFFCTTNIAKVPETILSRCAKYVLKPVSPTVLFDWLLEIVEKEGFDTPHDVVKLCVDRAEGSPRNALSNLSVCHACNNRKEAVVLIEALEVEEGGLPFKVAQTLANGASWKRMQELLAQIAKPEKDAEPVSPESVRQVVRQYFTTVVVNSKDEKVACNALRVLENFSEPFVGTSEAMSQLVVAIGRSIFT